MYKAFYSLSRTPFTKEIKAEEAYRSALFIETQARLEYLKKTRGMGLLIGEPGAGKTFAVRAFAATLNPALYQVIYFPMSTGSVSDFYRGLAQGLGEEPKTRKVDLFRQIQHAIESRFRERKITPVLILDEMQMAKDVFLNDLSLLFNFQMDAENPFVLLLVGLPHLRDRLGLNQNRPLAQRILMRCKLEAMGKEEVTGYVQHHLKLAGANHPIFTDAAIEAIATRSQGVPRVINLLTTHCLLYGCQMKKEQIDEEVVRYAAEEAGL
ncbi:MAG: ExeA family protein [Halobacteriota archaeon]